MIDCSESDLDSLTQIFEDRLLEIEAYLSLLDALEDEVQNGPPAIGDSKITALQQRILYSSVYLQLYNLVEATANWCVSAVCAAATKGWQPHDLSRTLRREWVRQKARTHVELNQENRLDAAVKMCDDLIELLPAMAFGVERGRAGSWDEDEISAIALRLGLDLSNSISPDVFRAIKRRVRDDKGSLALIRDLRNRLAHGSLSFGECGEGVTVRELRDVTDRTTSYLREVVSAFSFYIDRHEFLIPASRPRGEESS